MKITEKTDEYWQWLVANAGPRHPIAGKYLFFSDDRSHLLDIARTELSHHRFEIAKVNLNLLDGITEYVLCLYYRDDSRRGELAQRNRENYHVKYRFWKSDAETLMGKYSPEFISNLSPELQRQFTLDKTR